MFQGEHKSLYSDYYVLAWTPSMMPSLILKIAVSIVYYKPS